ncbi:MAG: type I restriction-modification system subunit M N-terminal domain-containing protein [Verrucomicrobia bacterium]|nr:type I restriction-modification system subunit M N-terminal domain-containing protein [Verrucomicrobiota bacterium]
MQTPAHKPVEPIVKPFDETVQERGSAPLSFGPQLWSAADRLRGHLDAAEYKHIVLGLIFLRFLSTTDDVPLKQMAFVLKDGEAFQCGMEEKIKQFVSNWGRSLR